MTSKGVYITNGDKTFIIESFVKDNDWPMNVKKELNMIEDQLESKMYYYGGHKKLYDEISRRQDKYFVGKDKEYFLTVNRYRFVDCKDSDELDRLYAFIINEMKRGCSLIDIRDFFKKEES